MSQQTGGFRAAGKGQFVTCWPHREKCADCEKEEDEYEEDEEEEEEVSNCSLANNKYHDELDECGKDLKACKNPYFCSRLSHAPLRSFCPTRSHCLQADSVPNLLGLSRITCNRNSVSLSKLAEAAFNMGLSCPVRHYASRSLQVVRALGGHMSAKCLTELLSRLVDTVAETAEEVQVSL
ncbi:unnamed protein product [Protopolystoma xenopodis]|uniref:Uncharacterized protein n=1 Tax=Protopolystoma xenopodis TaxID=117903 RepID=A0A448X727_9PLAT|nr:unnamed protein product [Protopolystoma xenopodis]